MLPDRVAIMSQARDENFRPESSTTRKREPSPRIIGMTPPNANPRKPQKEVHWETSDNLEPAPTPSITTSQAVAATLDNLEPAPTPSIAPNQAVAAPHQDTPSSSAVPSQSLIGQLFSTRSSEKSIGTGVINPSRNEIRPQSEAIERSFSNLFKVHDILGLNSPPEQFPHVLERPFSTDVVPALPLPTAQHSLGQSSEHASEGSSGAVTPQHAHANLPGTDQTGPRSRGFGAKIGAWFRKKGREVRESWLDMTDRAGKTRKKSKWCQVKSWRNTGPLRKYRREQVAPPILPDPES